MKTRPVTPVTQGNLHPSTTRLPEAFFKMKENSIRHLPMADEDNSLIGSSNSFLLPVA
jgi:CBS domain-containing protein